MFEYFAWELFWLLFVIGIIGGIIYLVRRDKSEDKKLDALFWKKFALGSAVALIFPVMVYYGIETFTDRPVYSDYITIDETFKWDNNLDRNSAEYKQKVIEYNKQKQAYNDAVESRANIAFIVWLVLGVAAIAGGIFLTIPAVSTGFMWGGTFSVLAGYMEYLAYMSDAMMFASAVLALVGFVIMAYKKFGIGFEE
ncbi:hypothetical protein LCGC14_0886940 [marine sediment metagenome]|uniref:Uncharacterized protein n=1 Tax=marine sediment metagenome TaxID=412755 RepID=A0A0F9S763_9ZZZZ